MAQAYHDLSTKMGRKQFDKDCALASMQCPQTRGTLSDNRTKIKDPVLLFQYWEQNHLLWECEYHTQLSDESKRTFSVYSVVKTKKGLRLFDAEKETFIE